MSVLRLCEKNYCVKEGDLPKMESVFEFDTGVVWVEDMHKVVEFRFGFVPEAKDVI